MYRYFILTLVFLISCLYVFSLEGELRMERYGMYEYQESLKIKHRPFKLVTAWVTGFNTLEEQTDSSPCMAAGGYICGRTDVVACPRYLALHSKVNINGKDYECIDRTALKYNGRFDISFDKDVIQAHNFGKRLLKIKIYK